MLFTIFATLSCFPTYHVTTEGELVLIHNSRYTFTYLPVAQLLHCPIGQYSYFPTYHGMTDAQLLHCSTGYRPLLAFLSAKD